MKVTKVSKCKQLFKLYFGMKFHWKIAYLTLVSKFFCLLSCCQKVVWRNSARWRLKCKFKVNEGSLICDYEIWIRIWPSIKWKDWDRVRCFFLFVYFMPFLYFTQYFGRVLNSFYFLSHELISCFILICILTIINFEAHN